LLERLPALPPERRAAAARDWLLRPAATGDSSSIEEIVEQVCDILTDERYAALFGTGSLGEAPLAATLPDGRVIAGTVDRLVVEPGRVSVIDFKTGRVPQGADRIPDSHRRQMSAYADALRVIFPGREVTAALLYTSGPVLFELGA